MDCPCPACHVARESEALRHLLRCARCLPASHERDTLRACLRAEVAAALESVWQGLAREEGRRA